MDEEINRITRRHIARLLDDLGVSISPVQQKAIKREIWFLVDDIKQVKDVMYEQTGRRRD